MTIRILVCLTVLIGLAFYARASHAHDRWADGSQIPAWVKASCCGVADAHKLDPADVSLESDGYHIKDYPFVIPYGDALPSQDNEIWLFYSTIWNSMSGTSTPMVGRPICFFIPMGA